MLAGMTHAATPWHLADVARRALSRAASAVVAVGEFAGDGGDVAATGLWVAVSFSGVRREDLPAGAQPHDLQQVAARVSVVARSGRARIPKQAAAARSR